MPAAARRGFVHSARLLFEKPHPGKQLRGWGTARQQSAQLLVPEHEAQPGENPQVRRHAGTDQCEQGMHRLAVHRIEIHWMAQQAQCHERGVDVQHDGVPHVGDGHAVADGRGRQGLARQEDLEKLLEFAEKKVGTLADAIFDGEIGISPYQMGTKSPCVYCVCRPVCRFDTTYNGYRQISVTRRDAVLDEINPGRKLD